MGGGELDIGSRFGSLTTISASWLDQVGRPRNGNPRLGSFVEVQCDCGVPKTVRCADLRSGSTKTCGMGIHLRNRRHGQYKSLAYSSWVGMIQRTTNPKVPGSRYWGGRGIIVCDRWRSFQNFLADMGERPGKEYTLDRRNNDGNYEPGNCRWATRSEQHGNQRNPRQRCLGCGRYMRIGAPQPHAGKCDKKLVGGSDVDQ